ncbi:MAG: tetratricopeptide repeat protein [Clostridia bacterium]|nr:tetratricopeptide repeat protein [Clostridia bacterium]
MSEIVKATKVGQLFEEYSNIEIGGRTLDMLNRIKEDPENAELWHMYGWLLMFDYRLYKEGVAAVSRAISLNPFKFEYWVSKGWILLKLHRFEDACAAYAVAERMDPTSWIPLYHWAMARVYLKEYDEAVKMYERALSDKTYENSLTKDGNNMDWAATVHWYWLTYMLMGQPDKAQSVLDRVVMDDKFYYETTPVHDVLRSDAYNLPCLMYKGYLEPEALLAMAEGKDNDTKANYYSFVGIYLDMIGRKEEAADLYRKVAEALGDNTPMVQAMVLCSERLKVIEAELNK